MDSYVSGLHASSQTVAKLRSSSFTKGGQSLSWHDLDSYFRFDKEFDVAVMADCSNCPLGASFRNNVKKAADTSRKHGVRPAFFMTWAYANKPEMTAVVAEAYTTAANESDAFVIPAGLAFARATSQKRDINLNMPDNHHPTEEGSYLAACTTYAALFHRSPVGFKYTATLGKATATFLQTVAWETVRDYYVK